MNVEQLSLFKDDKKIFSKTNSIIISASRMTDMPKFYPKELINEVKSRMDKGTDMHTLVLWSKHPDSLLENELFNSEPITEGSITDEDMEDVIDWQNRSVDDEDDE